MTISKSTKYTNDIWALCYGGSVSLKILIPAKYVWLHATRFVFFRGFHYLDCFNLPKFCGHF